MLMKNIITLNEYWLSSAKYGLNQGVKKFGAPLVLAYWISDCMLAPEHKFELLAIRVLMVSLILFLNKKVQECVSISEFYLYYFIELLCFSLFILSITLLYIFNTASLNYIYFINLVILAAGTFTFFPIKKSYLAFAIIIIFLPYFILTLSIDNLALETSQLVNNILNSACLITIFIQANLSLSEYQRKEHANTINLELSLKNREEEIYKLGNELSKIKYSIKIKQYEDYIKDELIKRSKQLSHDIRSPLTALNVIAKEISTHSPEMSKILSDVCNRINSLAEHVLITKSNIPTINFNSIVNLNEVINSVVDEKKLAWSKTDKNINLIYNSINLMTTQVAINRYELESIISNILDNSFDACKINGEIAIQVTDVDKKTVCITITDNGHGIPKDIIGNIGKYGFTYNKINGNGLGLANAKTILISNGGSLIVESKESKGTVISIHLVKP